MSATCVLTVRIGSLAAAVWRVAGENEPRVHVSLHRHDPLSGSWKPAQELRSSELETAEQVSDLAFAWIHRDAVRRETSADEKQLRLGTEPAGEGMSCLPVRPHRGQGPDGLSGASRDDDGRVRQGERRGVERSNLARRTDRQTAAEHDTGTPTLSASCGALTARFVSRPSCLLLAPASLAGCTPDAPVGADGKVPASGRVPFSARLASSTNCKRNSSFCTVSPLFSGVCRVYRFPEPSEERFCE